MFGLFATGRRRSVGGFTLLEVLVSIGIVVIALAGIAALLPAAGARLGEATEIDRAGTLAANAQADLVNRGLVRASLWPSAAPAVVFGAGLLSSGTVAAPHSTIVAAAPAEVSARITLGTGFESRDALRTSGSSGVVVGYEPGMCYGCLLSTTASGIPVAGDSVRVATVVFRSGTPTPAVQSFSLARVNNSAVFTSGSGVDAAALRRRFLAPCSWVLAVGSGEPRWIRIASSWTVYPSGTTTGQPTGTSFVALSGSDFTGLVSGTTLSAWGFEGLLRVDERIMNLE